MVHIHAYSLFMFHIIYTYNGLYIIMNLMIKCYIYVFVETLWSIEQPHPASSHNPALPACLGEVEDA